MSLINIKSYFGKTIRLLDGTLAKCNVVALLTNQETGVEKVVLGANLVVNTGDHWYAHEACGETSLFTVAGMRLGTNAGSASSPVKGDVDLEDTTTSTYLAGSGKAIDGGYPKSNDDDSDNTGAGDDVVTWRTSWTTGEANSANIASLDIVDNLTTPASAICVANFTSKFEKTSSDTLKVFVNHTMNGV
jgi:hypothetical protein